MEETNLQKIKKLLKEHKKLSKTELANKANIHPYLIDNYLNPLLKNNIIIQETNKSGKFVYYKLK